MRLLGIFILAVSLSLAFHYGQGDVRLDGADEGFYWYGVREVLQGKVPFRDFESYDPGRYYWGAAVGRFFGSGVMASRLAASLFQGMCLFFGLLALSRWTKSYKLLAVLGAMALLWMPVPFRYFDASSSMVAVFLALRFFEKPAAGRSALLGVGAALAAFFGRNHGLYFTAGFTLSILFLQLKGRIVQPAKIWGSFFSGFLAGLTPIFYLCLSAPELWEVYQRSTLFFSEHLFKGTVNIPRPVPWPWLYSWNDVSGVTGPAWMRGLHLGSLWVQGIAFGLPILFYSSGLYFLVRSRAASLPTNALFLASFFAGVPYLHHVYSRPDMIHLGEGILPVLLGCMSAPWISVGLKGNVFKKTTAAVLVSVTLLGAFPISGLFFKLFTPKGDVVRYRVGEDDLLLHQGEASFLEIVQRVVHENVSPGESILCAPLMTTLYCVLEKESPVWTLYFFRPATPAAEERVLRGMESSRVRWAFINDKNSLDPRPQY